jgi:hypothetical protein
MGFCGVAEAFETKEVGQTPRLMRTKTPTWCLQGSLRQFTDAQLRQYIADCCGNWEAVSGLVFSETTDRSRANIIILDHDFGDGPAGVLADAQLPGPAQQVLRFGREGIFVASGNPPKGTIDIIAVGTHEIGHIIGHYHLPSGGEVDLMEAHYRPGLRTPQKTESAMARSWYGPPKVTPVAPPPPVTPLGDSLGVELIIGKITEEFAQIERLNFTSGGRKYTANGQAKRVRDNQIVTGGLE